MISLRSVVTRKLLNYFFMNPQESLYVNELSKKLLLDKRNLVKKLKDLEKEGLLKSHSRGNLKFYSINNKYPLYGEYKQIVFKTIGFEDRLKKFLEKIDGIKQAYIYGSYALDKMKVHSDIDILIVGSHNIIVLQRALNKLQKEFDREINVINMDEKELKKRIKSRDTFIQEVLNKKHIELII